MCPWPELTPKRATSTFLGIPHNYRNQDFTFAEICITAERTVEKHWDAQGKVA